MNPDFHPSRSRGSLPVCVPWGLAALVLASMLTGCAPPVKDTFEEGRARFLANHVKESVPLLEQATRARPRDAESRAWLAEALRRTGRNARADSVARVALRLDPRHSFAHEVLGANADPKFGAWDGANADTCWTHLLAAVECDSTNGSAWSYLWLHAMSRGDRAVEHHALTAMVSTGFLTPSALSFGRWLLRDLPPDALLLTNGDMDTYPLVSLQETEGFRRDVAVANLSCLNLDWYRRSLRDRAGVRMPFGPVELDTLGVAMDGTGHLWTASDKVVDGWYGMVRAGTLGRPLAYSTTVSERRVPPEHVVLEGAYFLVTGPPARTAVDTTAVRRSIVGIQPAEFAGPWSGPSDRSPVRRVYSPGLANNVLGSAFQYVLATRAAGDERAAAGVVAWARDYAEGARLDSTGRALVEQMAGAQR